MQVARRYKRRTEGAERFLLILLLDGNGLRRFGQEAAIKSLNDLRIEDCPEEPLRCRLASVREKRILGQSPEVTARRRKNRP